MKRLCFISLVMLCAFLWAPTESAAHSHEHHTAQTHQLADAESMSHAGHGRHHAKHGHSDCPMSIGKSYQHCLDCPLDSVQEAVSPRLNQFDTVQTETVSSSGVDAFHEEPISISPRQVSPPLVRLPSVEGSFSQSVYLSTQRLRI
tara:strand:- start:1326 stop:1763 length:438 start_codon:yes stop_codon:yes gene_type:complete